MTEKMQLCNILLNAVNEILTTAHSELEGDDGDQDEPVQLQDTQPLY